MTNLRLRTSLLDSVLGGNWVGFLGSSLFFVKLHEFGEIELRFLEDLDLSDHAVVLKWVDLGAFCLDLFANFFFHEDLNELLES